MYITPAEDLTQVATIAWGRSLGLWALYIANIFALIAMLYPYWAISQTLLSNIVDKFKFHSDERCQNPPSDHNRDCWHSAGADTQRSSRIR